MEFGVGFVHKTAPFPRFGRSCELVQQGGRREQWPYCRARPRIRKSAANDNGARHAAAPYAKNTAPRKRSMVAWRRRLIPRVMQCPRHEYVGPELKKVQRRWCR